MNSVLRRRCVSVPGELVQRKIDRPLDRRQCQSGVAQFRCVQQTIAPARPRHFGELIECQWVKTMSWINQLPVSLHDLIGRHHSFVHDVGADPGMARPLDEPPR